MEGSEREHGDGDEEGLAWYGGIPGAIAQHAKDFSEGKDVPLVLRIGGEPIVVGTAHVRATEEGLYVESIMDHPLVQEILGAPLHGSYSIEAPIKLSEFNKIYNPRELSEEERIKKWKPKSP